MIIQVLEVIIFCIFQILRIMALKGVTCIEEPHGERTLGKTKVDTEVLGNVRWTELNWDTCHPRMK
jgi:hypothetical protein